MNRVITITKMRGPKKRFCKKNLRFNGSSITIADGFKKDIRVKMGNANYVRTVSRKIRFARFRNL